MVLLMHVYVCVSSVRITAVPIMPVFLFRSVLFSFASYPMDVVVVFLLFLLLFFFLSFFFSRRKSHVDVSHIESTSLIIHAYMHSLSFCIIFYYHESYVCVCRIVKEKSKQKQNTYAYLWNSNAFSLA